MYKRNDRSNELIGFDPDLAEVNYNIEKVNQQINLDI